ncbi:MAG: hypothetical protein AAB535_01265 [Patescibacteria group bacterium]
MAIDHFKETGNKPTQKDLINRYFGQNVPAIDIFIRTNEVKMNSPITEQEAEEVSNFYESHRDEVLGLGRRVGDLWIHDYHE